LVNRTISLRGKFNGTSWRLVKKVGGVLLCIKVREVERL